MHITGLSVKIKCSENLNGSKTLESLVLNTLVKAGNYSGREIVTSCPPHYINRKNHTWDPRTELLYSILIACTLAYSLR